MSIREGGRSQEPRWHLRIGIGVLSLLVIIFVFTVTYRWALGTYEGVEISAIHSLRVVIEVLTTAGFGGDTQYWQSTPVHLIVIAMNITAVVLIFVALPLFALPLLRNAIQDPPPTRSTLTDHVIICGYSLQDEVLREELEPRGISSLYVDTDADVISELTNQGINAIVGNPEELDTLEAANIEHARAIVADISDEVNPTIFLSAKQLNPDIRAISVIRRHTVETYHRYAGADHIVISRHQLGKSLGMRASATWAEKLQAAIEVESELKFTELLVEAGSDLVGTTLRESAIFRDEGVTVIGAWLGGKFTVSPPPDTKITANAILLVAGDRTDFHNFKARAIVHSDSQPSRVVLCGYGTVGWSARQTLQNEGIDVTVVDKDSTKDGVDIVGDITEPSTLERAGIEDARAVVLSLDRDSPSIFATLVINQIAPDVEIIVRAKNPENVRKLYSAGADFVLSLVTVTGETLAGLLIDEEEIITPDIEFAFNRVTLSKFTNQLLSDLDIRAKTGCTVVAIEREGELIADLMGDNRVLEGDTLIIGGTHNAHTRFSEYITTLES